MKVFILIIFLLATIRDIVRFTTEEEGRLGRFIVALFSIIAYCYLVSYFVKIV